MGIPLLNISLPAVAFLNTLDLDPPACFSESTFKQRQPVHLDISKSDPVDRDTTAKAREMKNRPGGSIVTDSTPVAQHPSIDPVSSIADVTALLAQNALPTTDLSTPPARPFFGMREDGELVAVIGLEIYPPSALLRSLAVHPTFRQRGLGRALVSFAESFAAARGVDTVFLLTTTADAWFRQLGYAPVSRDDAPPAICGTSQFSGLCCAAAVFLCKPLDPPES